MIPYSLLSFRHRNGAVINVYGLGDGIGVSIVGLSQIQKRLSSYTTPSLQSHKLHIGRKTTNYQHENRMWTRTDVLAFLQLLTMVIVAMLHAIWSLLIHRGNDRRYAEQRHEPTREDPGVVPLRKEVQCVQLAEVHTLCPSTNEAFRSGVRRARTFPGMT